MTRRFGEKEYAKGNHQDFNRRRSPNDTIAIDPALLGLDANTFPPQQNVTANHGGLHDRPSSHVTTRIAPGALPRSREESRRMNEGRKMNPHQGNPTVPQPSQQTYSRNPSEYPDAGLIDYVGLGDGILRTDPIPGSNMYKPTTRLPSQRSDHPRPSGDPRLISRGILRGESFQPNPIPESKAAPTIPKVQAEADFPVLRETEKRVTRSSKKWTSADAGLWSTDGEDTLEDSTLASRRSPQQSKRAKTSPKHNDLGDKSEDGTERIRKLSKLNAKIAEGRGPKRGSLGPNGEVRIRKDGRMEFRDVDNPEWTLAAYHKDYRRQFLDEAAEDSEFDHAPTRGEADDDETSYEPSQQQWGPSRADWQSIVNAEGKKVMFEVKKPESRHPPQEPSNWIHDGLVLLDSRNHPVKDWPGLNKTLSTEIESWRWEALMRVYPWLTVADLLARMPHTRKKKGKVMPLQTPQAFTNRAYRFRIPNQIPASNPKNGSRTYKEGILKNIAGKSATTTEALSTLDRAQVDQLRRANKGKFNENSRYVINGDGESTEPPSRSKKRKVHGNDDTESESGQEAKRPCTRTHQDLGAETPPEFANEYNVEDAYQYGQGYYEDSTYTDGACGDQGEVGTPMEDQNEAEDLVPLFLTTYDRLLALTEGFTTPEAVVYARENGYQQTLAFSVYWYRQSIPRHVEPEGNVVEDVVGSAFFHMIE